MSVNDPLLTRSAQKRTSRVAAMVRHNFHQRGEKCPQAYPEPTHATGASPGGQAIERAVRARRGEVVPSAANPLGCRGLLVGEPRNGLSPTPAKRLPLEIGVRPACLHLLTSGRRRNVIRQGTLSRIKGPLAEAGDNCLQLRRCEISTADAHSVAQTLANLLERPSVFASRPLAQGRCVGAYRACSGGIRLP